MSEPTNDKLRELLENPENLALIARLVGSMSAGGLGSLLSGGGGEQHTKEVLTSETADRAESTETSVNTTEETEEKEVPTSAVALPEKLPAFGRDMSTDKRIALLNALRPYINDSKKERVDGLVRALRVAGLLNQYKGTLL